MRTERRTALIKAAPPTHTHTHTRKVSLNEATRGDETTEALVVKTHEVDVGPGEEREVDARQGHSEGLVELHREVALAAELEQDEGADVNQAHLVRYERCARPLRCGALWGG